MVLHNLFFLVLTCAAYFSLIPLFEKLVADARAREVAIIQQVPHTSGEVKLSQESYRSAVTRAKLTLFLILGSIYILAVLLLESAIMPLYVYRPLRRMLEADTATQAGDRDREMIPPEEIMGDEIGQIMRSRNETVAALRRQEDELATALRRLEEQDRLVSLGLLSASVAHELNTPLAVLNGSIEKLIETTADPHTLERLERMKRVAQRLQRISESLVDFSKVRSTRMEPIAIRPLVDEAWGLVAIDEKASRIEFVNAIGAEDRVIGNPDRLIQVFVNLLRNAVNAIEGPSGRIEVNARKQKGRMLITIEDNGRGISADILPDIFDAFVTTRLDARGTGLGLTVAHGIVTQHGGTIAASNRPEGGARLEVSLPSAV
ncbi:MAG TPA: HAMP domain-containing sensor histidine kinase [Bryobacteraceae bacterium]|nr:HAMP domain-containing sensor histidine kinase [Bryobacteraceae bacterium]